MKLAVSSLIPEIDAFCAKKLGIPVKTLMQKAGTVIADAVRNRVVKNSLVLVLAGKGNNGGDGYAAAVELMDEYRVKVYDIFSAGQKTEEGNYFLNLYKSRGGEVVGYTVVEDMLDEIKEAGCIIDAIFGTGFSGETPEPLRPLAIAVREAVGAHKIAVDVPLGINPDNGSVSDFAITATATVALSFIKPGIISYPARAYVGEIIYSDLGIPKGDVFDNFPLHHHMIDEGWVERNLPKREENSNKGTFGKLLLITGSQKYRGAAHLTAEAALRGGVGLVTYIGSRSVLSELSQKFPEIIYKEKNIDDTLSESDVEEIVHLSRSHSATLVGSGSGNTGGILRLTLALLESEGGPLILDADAINALSTMGDEGIVALKRAKREVILTPHPLEFARLSVNDVASVQLHRLEAAEKFARENRVTLVLKGAGTIVVGGGETYINVTGSSALAKAGSGDVLAGFLSALVAQGKTSSEVSAALSVYIHALAGQRLAGELSSYGVTPSDLPREMARCIARIEENALI